MKCPICGEQMEKIDFESSSYEVVKWYDALKNIYKDNVKDLLNIDEKYNSYILDAISEDLRSINIDDIIKFVQENKGIWTCVSTKRKYSFIHRQPIILLLYYLACQKPYDLKRIWPLTESEIVPIFSDMGISM